MAEQKALQKLLEQLEEHLLTIDQMSFTLEELLSSIDIQHLIERRLQLSIEICIDIASHIAAEKKLPGRERAADVFLLLGKHKIIDEKLAEKLAKAVGFRNILIHEYAKINHHMVYHYYKQDLDDLRKFAQQIGNEFL
ncbi:MAG: DUF86 domain-containing protein [Actinobacteria bacterium]|nr:DUF86 domain-containing protein [Actinomycetota bacterium]